MCIYIYNITLLNSSLSMDYSTEINDNARQKTKKKFSLFYLISRFMGIQYIFRINRQMDIQILYSFIIEWTNVEWDFFFIHMYIYIFFSHEKRVETWRALAIKMWKRHILNTFLRPFLDTSAVSSLAIAVTVESSTNYYVSFYFFLILSQAVYTDLRIGRK